MTTSEGKVALFDSVTDWAFGPVFGNEGAAIRFLDWAKAHGTDDLRSLTNAELVLLWDRYCTVTEGPHHE